MGHDPDTDEFALIARHFAPLAGSKAARGLIDDIALIEAQGEIILTTDAIVEGVHFLRDDPLDLVARKALRVNMSDLVAKGGEPFGYLLTLIWPAARPASQIADIARGLEADQAQYAITLLGGDTAATPGPLTLSVTMLARAGARTPSRADAAAGEEVWVSGPIGEGGLGLLARRGELQGPDAEHFVARYRLPEPPAALAPVIASHARASMDISDGLLGDAAKIAAASGVAVEIEAGAIPLSEQARRWVEAQGDPWAARARLATAGDDYQALITAAPGASAALSAAGFTRIGRTRAGAGASLIGPEGPMEIARGGFAHRLGAS